MTDDDKFRKGEEQVKEITDLLRQNEADYFGTHGGAAEEEVYRKALTVGQRVMDAWQELYPALAIPRTALLTLEEMIWRAAWGAFSVSPDPGVPDVKASDLVDDPLYINDAIRCGLRHGEAITEPAELSEEEQEERFGMPLPPDLPPDPDTRH